MLLRSDRHKLTYGLQRRKSCLRTVAKREYLGRTWTANSDDIATFLSTTYTSKQPPNSSLAILTNDVIRAHDVRRVLEEQIPSYFSEEEVLQERMEVSVRSNSEKL